MNSLESELREATNELMDLALRRDEGLTGVGKRPTPRVLPSVLPETAPSGCLGATASGAVPADPTLELLASPSNTFDSWLPSQPGDRRQHHQIHLDLDVQEDEHLPSRGLSTIDTALEELRSSGSAKSSSRPCSPFATAMKVVPDIWLNEFGEKLVGGKVVSRMKAGRKRSPLPQSLHLDPVATSGSVNQADGQTSTHGVQTLTSIRSGPPAFFLQSFPDATQPAASKDEDGELTRNVPLRRDSLASQMKTITQSAPTSPTANAGPSAQRDPNEDGSDSSSVQSLLSLPGSNVTASSLAPSEQSITSGSLRRRLSRRRSGRAGGSRNNPRSRNLEDGEGGLFAREVKIRGWNEVGGKASGWVVFDVRVLTLQGITLVALRRFKSFVELRKRLAQECPEHKAALPSLPPRSAGMLHKYAAKHLEIRREALQGWLETVMLDARWGGTNALRDWMMER